MNDPAERYRCSQQGVQMSTTLQAVPIWISLESVPVFVKGITLWQEKDVALLQRRNRR
jgi:hypothetical protein